MQREMSEQSEVLSHFTAQSMIFFDFPLFRLFWKGRLKSSISSDVENHDAVDRLTAT